jgi:hypothetical protein
MYVIRSSAVRKKERIKLLLLELTHEEAKELIVELDTVIGFSKRPKTVAEKVIKILLEEVEV